MKKFLLLLITAVVSLCASAQTTIQWASAADWTTFDGGISYTQDGFTLKALKNNGSTAPNVNANEKDLRIYAKGTLTVSGKQLTKIVFNVSAQGLKRLAEIAPSTGSVAVADDHKTVTWTGDAASVIFTVGDKAVYGTDGNTKAGQLDIDNLVITGEGGEVTPDVPGGNDFEAPLTDAQGNWTFEDVVIPEDLTYIWSQSSSYGMKASAYANSTKYITESYLVSPALKLGENSVLTFEHVQRYSAEDPASQLSLWVREAGAEKWAAQLTIPTYSDGSSWTFVGSGDIDLAAYANKTIQIGFRYTSDENAAATWEIKNVKVTNASATEAGPTLKDPSNTLETAYTIAQAIEIINDKANYDMSKEVYVKGIITSIKSIDVSKYERAQYYIGETVDAETTIQVYNGYYLGGEAFTADDQIKVGDEVVVLGKLTLYNTTYEIDQNNKIVLLNGKDANGISNIVTDAANTVIYDLTGRRVNRAEKGLYIINGKKVLR